jgi:chromosomal replication initiator protein
MRVWFGDVRAVEVGSEYLTISVPNPFAKEYIETRFKAPLETALREELTGRASLRVVVHE